MKFALALLLVFSAGGRCQTAAALSDQALALAQQHRTDEAAKLWRQALTLEPNYFPALFNLGYMEFSAGHTADARNWLARAVRANSRDFQAHYLLGTILVGAGERDNALREWRAALALEPDNLKLMEVMIVEYEKGLYYNEAEALARRALELNRRDLNVYLMAIHACQNARDLAAGQQIARQAVAQFPESARANFEYGFHLQRDGRGTEAVGYLKKAMELDPKYEEPFFFYGDQLVTEGRDAEAIPFLRQAIADRADYLAPRISLARALVHHEKWQEATMELEAAARVDPRHPEPHLMLSRIYFRLGDEERAAREKELALRLRQENPGSLEAVQSKPFPR
jgi:tetratricopeptide (TPR) repeat protein